MVSEREPTAEKQLLNLIEKPKAENIQQRTFRRKGLSLFSLGALKGRWSFFKKQSRNSSALKRRPLDIKRINNILKFAVFVLAVYLATSFTISGLKLEKMPEAAFKTTALEEMEIIEPSSLLKKRNYYLERVRIRDIFNPLPTVTEANGAAGQKRKDISKISEAAKDLKLVGISWSDNPDAMIEDTNRKKVFFLKNGEMLNDIKIQAIFKDRVVLSYQGEELLLR